MLSSSFLFSSPLRFSLTARPISPGASKSKGGFSYTGLLSCSLSPPLSPGASRRFVSLTSPELCLEKMRYPTNVTPRRQKSNLERVLLPQTAIVSLPVSAQSPAGVSCPVELASAGTSCYRRCWSDPFSFTDLTFPFPRLGFPPHTFRRF